jgi:uncharacterized membrane protein YgdD (TMEM256/DUF423 family)
MKAKQIIFTAAILGALAVILGAFGAHKLKEILEPEKLETFKLGVNYQYFHVFALLSCGLFSLISKDAIKQFAYASICLIIGIAFFSGSLYLLSLKDVVNLGSAIKIIGPITPIGGLFFIAGWIFLGLGALKLTNN